MIGKDVQYKEVNRITKADIDAVISEFYSSNVSASTAAYRVTSQYLHRMRARAKAELELPIWLAHLRDLGKVLEGCRVTDTSHFDTTNCYQCRIDTLVPSLNSDNRQSEAASTRAIVLYCSILGPFAYVNVEECIDGDDLQSYLWAMPTLHELALIEIVTDWLISMQFEVITEATAQELVEGVSLEFTADGAADIFDCLFDEFVLESVIYNEMA